MSLNELPPGVSLERAEELVASVEQVCGLSDDPRVAGLRVATHALVQYGKLEMVLQQAFNLALEQMDLPVATLLKREVPPVNVVEKLREKIAELESDLQANRSYDLIVTERNRLRDAAKHVMHVFDGLDISEPGPCVERMAEAVDRLAIVLEMSDG